MPTCRSIHKLVLLLLISFPQFLHSQEKLLQWGDRRFEKFDFQGASKFYRVAVIKYPSSTEAKLKLADCYRLMNNTVKAELFYLMINEDSTTASDYYFHLAQALRANGNYELAKTYFNKYSDISSDKTGYKIAASLDTIRNLNGEHLYEIKLLSFNSSSSEFAPVCYNNGIVFVSNRQMPNFIHRKDLRSNDSFLQLFYVSADDNGEFSDPILFTGQEINGIYHEGPVTFSSTEDKAFLTRSNYKGIREVRGTDNIVHLNIYGLEYSQDIQEWIFMEEQLPFNSDNYSSCHPSLSSDGDELYFISDMPGGYGGTDIYVCKKHGNRWGEIRNLGPEINTPAQEMFPFILSNNILYFSSDGHSGLGGQDIYRTEKLAGNWKTPKNLGSPINSNKDDFGLSIDKTGRSGYFSSNRKSGYGKDDIYSFKVKKILLSGLVYDVISGDPVSNARINLTDSLSTITRSNGRFAIELWPDRKYDLHVSKDGYRESELSIQLHKKSVFREISISSNKEILLNVKVLDKTGKPLEGAKVFISDMKNSFEEDCSSTGEGICHFRVEAASRYQLIASKDIEDPNKKYLNNTRIISTLNEKAGNVIQVSMELDLVEIGVPVKIENIYYDLDKWSIRPDAAIELDKIVKVMKDNPSLAVELSSHTDSRGNDEYNKELSTKRARSAVEYIVSNSIDPSRISYKGYGEERLLNHCSNNVPCPNELHQQNRRTEFRILRF